MRIKRACMFSWFLWFVKSFVVCYVWIDLIHVTNTNPYVSHLSLKRPTHLHRSYFFSCVLLIFTCISLELAHILAEIACNTAFRPRRMEAFICSFSYIEPKSLPLHSIYHLLALLSLSHFLDLPHYKPCIQTHASSWSSRGIF